MQKMSALSGIILIIIFLEHHKSVDAEALEIMRLFMRGGENYVDFIAIAELHFSVGLNRPECAVVT